VEKGLVEVQTQEEDPWAKRRLEVVRLSGERSQEAVQTVAERPFQSDHLEVVWLAEEWLCEIDRP
jgi:hypothetical protein